MNKELEQIKEAVSKSFRKQEAGKTRFFVSIKCGDEVVIVNSGKSSWSGTSLRKAQVNAESALRNHFYANQFRDLFENGDAGVKNLLQDYFDSKIISTNNYQSPLIRTSFKDYSGSNFVKFLIAEGILKIEEIK